MERSSSRKWRRAPVVKMESFLMVRQASRPVCPGARNPTESKELVAPTFAPFAINRSAISAWPFRADSVSSAPFSARCGSGGDPQPDALRASPLPEVSSWRYRNSNDQVVEASVRFELDSRTTRLGLSRMV